MTNIIAYKGFNSDWTCRGFQYEVGKTYEHEGEVEACSSGFHSCENPMDVWSYYDIINADGELNKFAKVTASGELARHDDDSKIASAKITIEAELTIPEFIKSSVDWLMGLAKCDDVEAASGDSSKLAASGYSSKLAASGRLQQARSIGLLQQARSIGRLQQARSIGLLQQARSIGLLQQARSIGRLQPARSIGRLQPARSIGLLQQARSIGLLQQARSIGRLQQARSIGLLQPARSIGQG